MLLLAVGGSVAAVLLALPARPRLPARARPRAGSGGASAGWLRRFRAVLALLAGLGGVTFVGGLPGIGLGAGLAVLVWVVAGRAESPSARRAREQVRRELPQVVRLLGLALASGAPVATALGVVGDALPGPAAGVLTAARDRLQLGVPAEQVWRELADRPGLEPLARALARSSRTGASSADVIARLADDLAARARADVEDRARSVGIRAAVPLGACLLPAFVLLGIVPVVAATLTGFGW